MSAIPDEIRIAKDDLNSATVHGWAVDKYRLLRLYFTLFSKGMKNKWDQRIYIDLYAGGGISRLDGTNVYLKGSPLLALTVDHPFDKYIFCEENGDHLSALQSRTVSLAPHADVTYIQGGCDDQVEAILRAIPKGGSDHKVLSLCLVDPFDFGVKFSTLKRLSSVLIDFVVLLALGMDANRNYEHYVEKESTKIDEALGNSDWRQRWEGKRRSEFRTFLAAEFAASMETLGFLKTEVASMKLVRSDAKNLPLYYLALFSRHTKAHDFWNEGLKYHTDQRSLPFE